MASRKPSELNLTLPVIRSSLNWNQAELARAAGLPPNAISDFERGNRAFSAEKLEELAGVVTDRPKFPPVDHLKIPPSSQP